jgi:hypothetical protein
MAEIRYHLDEHMDAAIAVGLRRRGIDVTTTTEAKLLRHGDPEQIAFATREQRVLSLGNVASRRKFKWAFLPRAS